MTVSDPRPRWAALASVAVLLLLPLLLLWPCVVGDRTFLPYDTAGFPPVSTQLTPEQLAEVKDGANFDVTEVPVWFVPELKLAQQALSEGVFPHWNGYARGGTVLQAHGHVGLLYPPNWIALSQPDPADALVWLAYVNIALAGLLTFGLLRETRLGVLAALFGGVAFALSGTVLVNAHFFMRTAALIWLPGLLWASLRIAHHKGYGRIPGMICLALAMGMTWLAGFPAYAVASTLVAAGFCAFLVVREWRREGMRSAGALGVQLFAAAALGLGVAAAQLLPVLQFFPESHRALDPTLAQLSQSAFDPAGYLGYLFPDLFGHPSLVDALPYDKSPLALHLFRVREFGSGDPILPHYNFTEYTVFPGTLTLFLAFAGVFGRRRRFRSYVLGTLVVLGLLATFAWPLMHLFEAPAVKTVQPLRFMAPAALFVAWLAALGMDRAGDGLGTWLRRTLWIGGLLLAVLCVVCGYLCGDREVKIEERLDIAAQAAERYRGENYPNLDEDQVRAYMRGPKTKEHPNGRDYFEEGRKQASSSLYRGAAAFALGALWIVLLPWSRRRRFLRVGLPVVAVIVTATQLIAFGRTVDGGVAARYSSDTGIHDFLVNQRVKHAASGGFMVARAGESIGVPIELPPGTLGPLGIRDLNVYTFLDGRSHRPLEKLYESRVAPTEPELVQNDGQVVLRLPDGPRLRHPLLDLYGIRFLLSVAELTHAGERVAELHGPGGDFFVYERESPLPRAFIVPHLRVLPDDEAVLAGLVEPTLAPRREALITAAEMQRLGEPGSPGEPIDREVKFLPRSPSELVLEVSAGESGYLVLADTFMPGWSAEVNGVATHIGRCNAWMRVIEVPAERCKVLFRYYTPGLSSGLVLSVVSILVLMVMSLSFAFSRPRAGEADPL